MSDQSKKTGGKLVPKNQPLAFSEDDLQALELSYIALEHPSLAARLSGVVGTPIEIAVKMLPKKWNRAVQGAAETAIYKALDAAVSSMRRHHEASAREGYYKALAAGTGAVGGFFGIPGLLLELPLTTTLMLRGIAEIARDEGEDLYAPESQAACVQVFALGGTTEADDAAETGYYSVRLALSAYLTSTMSHVLNQSLSGTPTPAVVEFIRVVAKRFGVVLSQRGAAQLVPVVGAAGGAAINTIFMQHFQSVARAHFTVRRLERKYGETFVQSQFETLANEDQARRSSR